MKRNRVSARPRILRRYGVDAFSKQRPRAERTKEVRDAIFERGYWMQFPFVFVRMLSANSALLLGYLCNHSRLHADDDGWFYCRIGTIQKWFDWDRQKQWRELAKEVLSIVVF